MSYVKITGKNIGSCLTGFGVHFPVKVFNGGNEEFLYTIESSNIDNFNLSKNSFKLDKNKYTTFDVFYNPTSSNSEGDETTDLTITSSSFKDEIVVDPSGDITINLTGKRIVNITGGNPRSFRVVSVFEPVSYDFYWKPPINTTGDNLHNYFITGYTLQISTDPSFNTIGYSKNISVGQNTNPKFSTYYGFGDQDINLKVTKDEYDALSPNASDYYARIHTYSNNNSGVSVFASGVFSAADSVSEEVFSGYSGTPINIKILKKAFNFTIDTQASDDSYNLSNKIISANNNSDNFSSFNEINVYFPENAIFNSKDPAKGAIELDGTFKYFTGIGSDTNVNFYIPNTVKINGARGFGTDFTIPNNQSDLLNHVVFATTDAANYYNQMGVVKESTNGGPAFNLKLITSVGGLLRNDIKYNFFSQPQSSANSINFLEHIVSGSGGSKGGLVYTKNNQYPSHLYVFSSVKDSRSYSRNFRAALRGSLPVGFFTNSKSFDNYYIWSFVVDYWDGGRKTANLGLNANASIFSPTVGFGEMGSANFVVKTTTNQFYLTDKQYQPDLSKTFFLTEKDRTKVLNIDESIFFFPLSTVRNNRLPGKIIDSFNKNIHLKFDLYNSDVLPPTPIFRFKNSDINSDGLSWISDTTISNYTLSGGGTYNGNYKSLGSSSYKTINLKNNQFLDLNFANNNTVTYNYLNLFFVCSFDNIDDVYDSTVGITGNFVQSQSSVIITLTSKKNHDLVVGDVVNISFTKTTGAGAVPVDNVYTVVTVTNSTFTVTSAVSATAIVNGTFKTANLISLFNWVKTADQDINQAKAPRQFFIKDQDSTNTTRIPFRQYTKEKLNFVFFNNFLKTASPWSGDYTPQLSNNVKVSKQLYSLLSISSVNGNVITTTTNHNLSVNDTIGFVGDGLPSQISLYDISTPYTKRIYYVQTVPAANTFTISSSIGGTVISLANLSLDTIIHKVSSASLYQPFILEIKRDGTQDIFYINRIEVHRQPVNGTFITSLKGTKLSLINTGKIGINYFDCTCYDRLLDDSESSQIYSFFAKTYLSLFTGKPQSTNIDLQDVLYDFRLPNIFCIAGRT